jgi:S-formylglutathione hydrolase
MQPGWSRHFVAGKPVDAFDSPDGPPRFALLYLHSVGMESLADNAVWTAELARHRIACCAPFGMRSWWADRVCLEFDPELTAERHLLDNVLPWMAARWQPSSGGRGSRRAANDEDGSAGASPSQEPHRVAVAGISMGGQGALRLGFKYPERFPVVAGVASAIEYDRRYGQGSPLDDMYRSREACRQDTAGLHIQPNKYPPHVWFACDPADDEWHRGNDRLHEKLLALGVAHEADLDTTLDGHTWDYFDTTAPRLFAWLTGVMAKQARRLM